MLFINNKLTQKYVYSFDFVFEVKHLDSIGYQITFFFISKFFKVSLSRLTKLLISILLHSYNMLR